MADKSKPPTPRRVCVKCKKGRMSSLDKDRHLICPTCVGHICDINVRCDECRDWPEDLIKSYVRHQESLRLKRENVFLG